jgi:hypothetical protein
MIKRSLVVILLGMLIVPLQAQVLSDAELLNRLAVEPPTVTPQPAQRSSKSNGTVIGPIRDPKTGVRGAIINNRGDSSRARWRINRNRTAYKRIQIEAWPNADEVGETFRRDHYWFSENNFWESDSNSKKVSYDAWTHDSSNRVRRSLVVSCIHDPDTIGGKRIKLFTTSHQPVNMLGRPTRVWLDVGTGTKTEVKGTVSNVYVGNVHIDLTIEQARPIIERMRKANWIAVTIQTVQGLIPHTTRYNLKGFSAASANTTAACYY